MLLPIAIAPLMTSKSSGLSASLRALTSLVFSWISGSLNCYPHNNWMSNGGEAIHGDDFIRGAREGLGFGALVESCILAFIYCTNLQNVLMNQYFTVKSISGINSKT